jgi:CRP-like cAMP-binding protein
MLEGRGWIHLLDLDIDLARNLELNRAHEAAEHLRARVIDLPRGSWNPQESVDLQTPPIALIVVDGLLLREATVSDHPSSELLGPGDMLRTWDDPEEEELLPRAIMWNALTPTRVAVLDHAFCARAAHWPEVMSALLNRAARRAERLVVMQAIAHLTRVDDRVLALLWCLAERWGRVVPEGVMLSLRLSHRTLASMVGARRPSVTTALGQLMASNRVDRRPDGEWILIGEPPEVTLREAPLPLSTEVGV